MFKQLSILINKRAKIVNLKVKLQMQEEQKNSQVTVTEQSVTLTEQSNVAQRSEMAYSQATILSQVVEEREPDVPELTQPQDENSRRVEWYDVQMTLGPCVRPNPSAMLRSHVVPAMEVDMTACEVRTWPFGGWKNVNEVSADLRDLGLRSPGSLAMILGARSGEVLSFSWLPEPKPELPRRRDWSLQPLDPQNVAGFPWEELSLGPQPVWRLHRAPWVDLELQLEANLLNEATRSAPTAITFYLPGVEHWVRRVKDGTEYLYDGGYVNENNVFVALEYEDHAKFMLAFRRVAAASLAMGI